MHVSSSGFSTRKGSAIYLSKSGIRALPLPAIRKSSRPNGIFSLDSASDRSSCASDLSSSSSYSSDEWSDNDYEDPLWVKDDNLRPKRLRKRDKINNKPKIHDLDASPNVLPSRPAEAGDMMMIEEPAESPLYATMIAVVGEQSSTHNRSPESAAIEVAAMMTHHQPQPQTQATKKRTRTKAPRERMCDKDSAINQSETNMDCAQGRENRSSSDSAYQEFVSRLDVASLNALSLKADHAIAQRRQKAFSISLTPRGGLFSSSSTIAKASPRQRERERRKMEREVLTHQKLLQHQAIVPSLGVHNEGVVIDKGDTKTSSFFRKKMRGVKAYFSSSSSSHPLPSSTPERFTARSTPAIQSISPRGT